MSLKSQCQAVIALVPNKKKLLWFGTLKMHGKTVCCLLFSLVIKIKRGRGLNKFHASKRGGVIPGWGGGLMEDLQ